MSITDAITGVTAATASRPVENPGAQLDRDAFLKLLVAQLKYQDPSKPTDASELVAQSAQLTMVDKLNQIADSISEATAIDRLTLAGTMIGQDITFAADDGGVHTERAEAIRFDDGALTVLAGGYFVPLGAIEEVRAPVPAEPPAAPPAALPAASP